MKYLNMIVFTLLISLLSLGTTSFATEVKQSQAVFEVAWYDVGKAALEGQSGVIDVDKGWRKGREINTVFFDPTKISVESMEQSLKKSGTFIRTVPD